MTKAKKSIPGPDDLVVQTFRLPDHVKMELKLLALKRRITVAEMINQALKAYLKKERAKEQESLRLGR